MCFKIDYIYANCTHLADPDIRWTSLCEKAKPAGQSHCLEFESVQNTVKGNCPTCLGLSSSKTTHNDVFKTPELLAYEAAIPHRELQWETIDPRELKLATANSQVNPPVNAHAGLVVERRSQKSTVRPTLPIPKTTPRDVLKIVALDPKLWKPRQAEESGESDWS